MRKTTFACIAAFVLSVSGAEASGWDNALDLTAGVGPSFGHNTYQIGGTVKTPEGVEEYWFPISELSFPMNTAQATIGMDMTFARRVRLSLEASMNLTEDAGTMEDSDYMTEWNPNQLDVYSKSDAEMEMLIVRAGVLYNIAEGKIWSIAAGAGFMYQDFSYECYDFDQWYPSEPWAPHDYYRGLGITYDVTYSIPYLQVAGELTLKDKFEISAGLGIAPYVYAEDRDNHVLREIIAEGEYDGVALLVSIVSRYNLSRHWFVEAGLTGTGIAAEGAQENYVPVEWSHTTDAELTSSQGIFTISLGAFF